MFLIHIRYANELPGRKLRSEIKERPHQMSFSHGRTSSSTNARKYR